MYNDLDPFNQLFKDFQKIYHYLQGFFYGTYDDKAKENLIYEAGKLYDNWFNFMLFKCAKDTLNSLGENVDNGQ